MITYANDITTTTRIKAHECWDCGVPYGLSDRFEQKRREDHRTFYCPNGHPTIFPYETEAERLAKELAAEERRRQRAEARATHAEDQRQATEYSLRTTKGHLTRARRRAAAGVCPVESCQRSFKDLASHVAGQHPEFAAEHGITT